MTGNTTEPGNQGNTIGNPGKKAEQNIHENTP